MKFTQEEANLIKELAKMPVTVPLNEAAQIGEMWQSIIEKIDALTETGVDIGQT
jgi:hypothetical protein